MRISRNMIGPQLRRIRFERGLTQLSLASMCQRRGWDISRETLAKIEGQTRWVADFELVFLADTLDIPPTTLLPDKSAKHIAKKFISALERALE